MDRRWWVVLVGVASMGMPRPSWQVRAELPANDDATRARVVAVEGSHAPTLTISDATTTMQLGDREAPWTGSGTFFVPAGVRVDDVRIVGYCSGGACCRCATPKGANVRVIGVRPVGAWKIERRGEVDRVHVREDRVAWSRVTIRPALDAGGDVGPPRLAIESDVRPSSVQVYEGGFNIQWPMRSESFEWRPVVVIEGACTSGERECAAPAGAELVIERVATEVTQTQR